MLKTITMFTIRPLHRLAIFVSTLVLCAAVLATPNRAEAQSRNHPFGLGLRLGYPTTALTGKFWLDSRNAIQVDVPFGSAHNGFYVGGGGGLAVDWVYRFAGRRGSSIGFGFHAGVGGEVWFAGCYYRADGRRVCGGDAAIRFPVAVNFYFPRPSLELLLELFPRLTFLKGPLFDYGGSIGLRYYF